MVCCHVRRRWGFFFVLRTSRQKEKLTSDGSYGLFKAADKKLLDDEKLSDRLSTVDKIVKE